MRAYFQGQSRRNRLQSRHFHWRRLMIFLLVSLPLAYGTLLIILASGNIISSTWFYVLAPVITLIGILLTLYPLVFPSSVNNANHSSPPQLPPSTHLTRQ